MRTKAMLVVALIGFTVGCSRSPSSSPTVVVKQFIGYLESGDANSWMKLVSNVTVKNNGEEVVRTKFQKLSEAIRQVKAEGGNPQIEKTQESITGDEATVTLVYVAREKDELANLRFTLDKEGGEWKVSGMNLIE